MFIVGRSPATRACFADCQLINFSYVPVRHQLNFVLVVSLFWTTFLSLAFPPGALPFHCHHLWQGAAISFSRA
eukprot:347676-Pleurochrysis_carterae.AAC.2